MEGQQRDPMTDGIPPPEPAGANGPLASPPDAPSQRRPILERIGLAAVALVLAGLFGIVSAAAFSGGEPFLAIMAAIGCLMTVWVGLLTILRG